MYKHVYICKEFHASISVIDLMSRVFGNGPGHRGSISDRVIKAKKNGT